MDLKEELYPLKVISAENADTMSAMAAQFLNQNKKCICFLRKTSRETFTQKLLCALADVSYEKTQDGTVDEAEWARLFAAADRLARGTVQIDSGEVSDENILMKCKSLPRAEVVLILSLAK